MSRSEIVEQDIPVIKQTLKEVLGNEEYSSIERMGGLTNHTYHVTYADGKEYVIRIPGEGTEEMIVRSDEEKSTKLACDLGIDAKIYYFGKDGSKITEYIKNAITMSSETLHEDKHIAQMAEIFKKLHTCGKDTGIPFEVFDMAEMYKKIINDNNVAMFDNFCEIEQEVMRIKAEIDCAIPSKKVPCHNDALCENWVEGDGKMYLIDWEYAGMNDGMWDLADVSIEAGFGEKEDMSFLEYYLESKPTDIDKKHFFASKIYVDYLWTLWAKTRVPFDGQLMEDWATERYERLMKNIEIYNKI